MRAPASGGAFDSLDLRAHVARVPRVERWTKRGLRWMVEGVETLLPEANYVNTESHCGLEDWQRARSQTIERCLQDSEELTGQLLP